MSENQGTYDIVNKLLQKKVYEYDGPLNYSPGINLKFKYKIKILGDMSLKHMGEPMNHIAVELIIVDMEFPIFLDLFKGFDSEDLYKNRFNIEDKLYSLVGRIKNNIWSEMKYFSLTDTPEIAKIKIDIPELPSDNMKQITETKSEKRNVVRKVVEDIIYLFKLQGEGEYTLPEDITGEITYEFENLKNDFNVELRIQESDEVDTFELDGGYYEDEETIEIEIVFNPEAFPKSLYELVGDLNETFRHELQHHLQYEKGDENPKGENDPEKYYSQPHELDAQVAGIKRKSKITKQPFELLVRDWFAKNKNKHRLDGDAQERVIQKVLQYYNNAK